MNLGLVAARRAAFGLVVGVVAVLGVLSVSRSEESASHAADGHEAAAAEGEHAGKHAHIGHANASPGLETNPADIKSDLAVWTFVVFLVLLVVLWKFAWGPIATGLEKREHSIADEIAAAQRAHEEAKQLLAEHERKLAGTADEIRAMMEQARRDGEHVKAEILAEAKAGADAERTRAIHDIEAATDQALHSLAEKSADIVVDLAGKIVKSKLSPEEHSRLVREAVSRFSDAQPSQN